METGYKYNSKQSAIDARQKIDVHFSFEQKENGVTKHYSNYYEKKDELGNVEFYYILYSEGLENVLGNPINFNVQ